MTKDSDFCKFNSQGIVGLMSLNHLESVEDMSAIPWGSSQHVHSGIEAIRMSFFDALLVSRTCRWR